MYIFQWQVFVQTQFNRNLIHVEQIFFFVLRHVHVYHVTVISYRYYLTKIFVHHLLFVLCLHKWHGESGSCHLNCWQTPLYKSKYCSCKQCMVLYGTGFNLTNLEKKTMKKIPSPIQTDYYMKRHVYTFANCF